MHSFWIKRDFFFPDCQSSECRCIYALNEFSFKLQMTLSWHFIDISLDIYVYIFSKGMVLVLSFIKVGQWLPVSDKYQQWYFVKNEWVVAFRRDMAKSCKAIIFFTHMMRKGKLIIYDYLWLWNCEARLTSCSFLTVLQMVSVICWQTILLISKGNDTWYRYVDKIVFLVSFPKAGLEKILKCNLGN